MPSLVKELEVEVGFLYGGRGEGTTRTQKYPARHMVECSMSEINQ